MKSRILQFLCLSLAIALSSVSARAALLPMIACSSNQVLECTSSNGAPGTVQATVQDPNGLALMVVWLVNGASIQTNYLASGTTSNAVELSLTYEFGFGTNDVSVGISNDGSIVVSCATSVVVRDTTPPVIHSVTVTPDVLWPPNHRLIPIRLNVVADDACGPVTWRVFAVQSSEAVDAAGSGHTAPDWVIKNDHHVSVRAERSGRGPGRVYTITVQATDDAGNHATKDVTVFVPHDRGHGRGAQDADDDAQGKPPGRGNPHGRS